MKQEKIELVTIDSEFEELAGEYLRNRRQELSTLQASFSSEDYKTIQRLGHNMKGNGASYGFPKLSDIGNRLEMASLELQRERVKEILFELETYLANVRIEIGAKEAS